MEQKFNLLSLQIQDDISLGVEHSYPTTKPLGIEVNSFNTKLNLLNLLHNLNEPVKLGKNKPQLLKTHLKYVKDKIEYNLVCSNGCVIVVTLQMAKNKAKWFLNARCSPTKLATGQNILQPDSKWLSATMEEHKLSEFEALSLLPFIYLQEVFLNLNKPKDFFSYEEFYAIVKNGEININSVTFASYLDFGKNRDRVLDFLSACLTAYVYIGGRQIPLYKLTRRMNAKTWPHEEGAKSASSFFSSLNSGLLITLNNKDDSPLYKYMLYCKDYEIKSKFNKASSNKNYTIYKENPVLGKQLHRFVRMDLTLFKSSLVKFTPEDSLTLKSLNKLLHDEAQLKPIILSALAASPIATTLFSMNYKDLVQVELHNYSAEFREMVSKWLKPTLKSSLINGKVTTSWVTHYNGNQFLKERIKFYNETFVDLSFPIEFYRKLSLVRENYFQTLEEEKTLELAQVSNLDIQYNSKTRKILQKRFVEFKRTITTPFDLTR